MSVMVPEPESAGTFQFELVAITHAFAAADVLALKIHMYS